MTVFLTTHYMEEAAEADYVVIIDDGKISAEGTPLELKNIYTGDYITIYGVEAVSYTHLDVYKRQVPDTTDKVPNSASKVPDTTDKVPDNAQEQQIYRYVLENGSITTAETVELLDVKHRRARAILLNMIKDGYLRKEGAARSTIYVKDREAR